MTNPESTATPKLIELPDFIKKSEAVETESAVRSGEVQSYPPRSSNVELNLSTDQIAQKLAEKQEHERQLDAASKSVAEAYKNSVDNRVDTVQG